MQAKIRYAVNMFNQMNKQETKYEVLRDELGEFLAELNKEEYAEYATATSFPLCKGCEKPITSSFDKSDTGFCAECRG